MKNKTQGKCFCCNTRMIYFDDFQAGHVTAVANGGSDDIQNLRPVCGPCNRGMGTMNMLEYRKEIYGSKPKKKTKSDSLPWTFKI